MDDGLMPPLDGEMNGHIGQVEGQIDDGLMSPLDAKMNGQIGDEFMSPLDRQMDDYIGQMNWIGPPSSSEANGSELFPTSTKLQISKFSKNCWLCGSTPYQAARVLGRADTGVLLLQRT
jgi:hypothetical protein